MTTQRTLRLVLGDQLTDSLTSLRDVAAGDLVLMAEVMAEATYVRHHKQKLVMVFSAMRQFAARLQARGIDVRYVGLEDADNTQTLTGELQKALAENHASRFTRVVLTEPGEWRLLHAFRALQKELSIPLELRPDERFICSHRRFGAWAERHRQLRMELFYREMRVHTGLLMEDDQPAGGQWNYDRENRRRPPRELRTPARHRISPSETTQTVMQMVTRRFPDHFGDLDSFGWATCAAEAAQLFEHFLTTVLPAFGDWQDAMRAQDPFMWHGLISAALNIGLLDPMSVCQRVDAEYRRGRVPLNCAEGFIRQILGWREFVRGVYWLRGADYTSSNFLRADRKLPWFYWSGETDMACVRDVVSETREHAYAHHIQRLMVTGNLAMLLGVHPDEVNEWYMVVFIDAFEWVEAPNTHGMATFADGGVVGSKPYAASGAYINRMSDYCPGCAYDVKLKRGESACPFNVLYWDFLLRHRPLLGGNPRLRMPYHSLARMSADHAAIRKEAEAVRARLGATPRQG
jgi:deoxyribodipyrimidine photolyase-related protein